MTTPTFYEFFAGGGMARMGLGSEWRCIYANDFDAKKGAAYSANWGDDVLQVEDVAAVASFELPGQADLAWASFPCQDLSLAGTGAGLKGDRSGAFWSFWKLMSTLRREGRAPKIIALENVCGLLSSHGGDDFAGLCRALARERYRFGALVADAADFVPQSRPRLFIIAIQDELVIPDWLCSQHPSKRWHNARLLEAYTKLPDALWERWHWFNPTPPPRRNMRLIDIIEDEPSDVVWHSEAETARLLNMMNTVNRAKVDAAVAYRERMVGTIYKRTRVENRIKVQRAEVRFDDVAGCLRTPAGGSSRQFLMLIANGQVRSRLLSARETARLMGLPDEYKLPGKYNDAYHVTGDGVAVPVVRFLAESIFEPLARANRGARLQMVAAE